MNWKRSSISQRLFFLLLLHIIKVTYHHCATNRKNIDICLFNEFTSWHNVTNMNKLNKRVAVHLTTTTKKTATTIIIMARNDKFRWKNGCDAWDFYDTKFIEFKEKFYAKKGINYSYRFRFFCQCWLFATRARIKYLCIILSN